MPALSTTSQTVALGSLQGATPTMVWVIVLGFVFAECAFIIGLFLPGDSLLFTAGVVLAAGDHFLHAWTLSVAAVVVAVAGNMLGFWIGRRSGSLLIARKGGRMLTREHLERAERFLNKHGWWAIVLARWIPWIRTLAPLIAGAAKMDARRYLLATAIGAVLWVPALVLAGYYGAALFHRFSWVQHALTIASIVCFVLGTAYGLWRYWQEMHKPKETVAGVGGSGELDTQGHDARQVEAGHPGVRADGQRPDDTQLGGRHWQESGDPTSQ